MPTPAEIAARKAILEQFRSSFNVFAEAYNTAFSAVSALGLPEYSALITALKLMAGEVNKASPAVTAAIQEIDMLIRPPPINRPTVPSQPPAEGFTPSANGFTVPDDGAELTDNQGQVWSLSGNVVLVNGLNFNWGWGNAIKFWDGLVYHRSPPPGPANWLDWWFDNSGYVWRNNGTTEPGTVGELIPTAPSVCTATMVSHARNNVAWQDNSDNEVGFKIERKETIDGTWAQIATPEMNAEFFASTGLKAATGYDYRVASYNQAGTSAWSNVASATTDTAPALPGALELKESATTGAISAGFNQLVVASSAGFAEGDWVTVEIGQEPGGGMRGTKGVGGAWPALSYANGAALVADTTQAPNTYAWREDTGDVMRWNSSFGANQWMPIYGYNGSYYFIYANPRALQAQIVTISGTTWTLDRPAKVSVTGANVYFDNAPVLNEALAKTVGAAAENVTVVAPAGDFAVGGVVQIGDKTGWTFGGQGIANTRMFSPKGCPSARLEVYFSPGTTVKDFTWQGNMGDNQFGMSWHTPGFVFPDGWWPAYVSETLIPQGPQFPKGVEFGFSPNSVIQDVRVIDVFQRAVGVSYCNNVWAYRVENIQNAPMREYGQHQMLWTDATGGGCVDCTISSDYLTTGFESAKSTGVSFIRCTGVNATFSMNSAGGYVIEDANLTFTSMCGFPEFPIYTPIINLNSNFSAQSPDPAVAAILALGGTVNGLTIVQQGYIDANNNTLIGIVVNENVPNISITNYNYTAPNYAAPSPLNGAQALNSTGQNTVVTNSVCNGNAYDMGGPAFNRRNWYNQNGGNFDGTVIGSKAPPWV